MFLPLATGLHCRCRRISNAYAEQAAHFYRLALQSRLTGYILHAGFNSLPPALPPFLGLLLDCLTWI
jgi:hypothetical protein